MTNKRWISLLSLAKIEVRSDITYSGTEVKAAVELYFYQTEPKHDVDYSEMFIQWLFHNSFCTHQFDSEVAPLHGHLKQNFNILKVFVGNLK